MSTCKIALLIPNLNGGGAQRVIVNLANFLSETGNQVWIITTSEGIYFDSIHPQVTIKIIPKWNFILLGINIAKLIPIKLISIINNLKKIQPDILLCTLQSANILGPYAKLMGCKKTKVIIREANTFHRFRVSNLSFQKMLSLNWSFYEMKISYRLADLIIANSPDTAKDVQNFLKIPRNKIKIIFNPIYTSEIYQFSCEKSGHKWVDTGENYIVSIGRLHPQKDFETLIKAFALLQSKHSIKLIILGVGEEENKLKKLVTEFNLSEKVDFAGFQDNPYPYLRNARVFVLSSKWEGFGNVLVEALSVGTPVVATNCSGGPSLILNNGKYGTLINVGDFEAMSKAIEEILLNKELYPKDKLINRAKEFSIEKIGKEYVDSFLHLFR
jgi:glycosyltransferase involved in cell wall biosynthesis